MQKLLKLKNGFTLAELLVAVVLTAVVITVGARLYFSATNILTQSQNLIDINTNSELAIRDIDNAMKYSTAVFTVPEQSFIKDKLDHDWSYIGVMSVNDSGLPTSFTNKLTGIIPNANLLLNIKPLSAEPNSNSYNPATECPVQVGGKWFLYTVYGYDHKDEESNVTIKYDLTLKAGSSPNTASDSMIYDFTVNYYDAEGNIINNGDNTINLNNKTVEALNARQLVYNGSDENPAKAIAFYVTEINTTEVTKTVNVLFVIDTSGSMDYVDIPTAGVDWWGHPTTVYIKRIQKLRELMTNFVNDLSGDINISIVEYSHYASIVTTAAGNSTNISKTYSGTSGKTLLTNKISKINANGGTNIGDGMRIGYYEMNRLNADTTKTYENIIILITDGEMNTWTVANKWTKSYDPSVYDIKNFFLDNGLCKYLYAYYSDEDNRYSKYRYYYGDGGSFNMAYSSSWNANTTDLIWKPLALQYFTKVADMYDINYDNIEEKPEFHFISINPGGDATITQQNYDVIQGYYGVPYSEKADFYVNALTGNDLDIAFNNIKNIVSDAAKLLDGPGL